MRGGGFDAFGGVRDATVDASVDRGLPREVGRARRFGSGRDPVVGPRIRSPGEAGRAYGDRGTRAATPARGARGSSSVPARSRGGRKAAEGRGRLRKRSAGSRCRRLRLESLAGGCRHVVTPPSRVRPREPVPLLRLPRRGVDPVARIPRGGRAPRAGFDLKNRELGDAYLRLEGRVEDLAGRLAQSTSERRRLGREPAPLRGEPRARRRPARARVPIAALVGARRGDRTGVDGPDGLGSRGNRGNRGDGKPGNSPSPRLRKRPCSIR